MEQINPIPEKDLDTQTTSTTQQNVTHSKSNKLFLPKKALEIYGCKNCIWKNYGQCPHNLEGDDIYEFTECFDCNVVVTQKTQLTHKTHNTQKVKGYCTEFVEFILSFGEIEDGISAVMQKFFVYTQQMQAMADNSEFNKKFRELKEFKTNSEQHKQEMGYEGYKQKMGELEMSMITYKIWWSRLTDSIIKALGQIADRERRSKDVKGTQKITVQQLNVLLKESDKTLKELE